MLHGNANIHENSTNPNTTKRLCFYEKLTDLENKTKQSLTWKRKLFVKQLMTDDFPFHLLYIIEHFISYLRSQEMSIKLDTFSTFPQFHL